jgi:hypothetical protein
MKFSKGDLVLVSDEEKTLTCILLTELYTTGGNIKFYYSHCLETGQNGIIYESEITSLVLKDFHPNFQHDSDVFDEQYLYEVMVDAFSYWPMFWPFQHDYDDED